MTKKEIKEAQKIIDKIQDYYEKRIIGRTELFDSILIALMTNGHILIESVPGLAKTEAAKVIANSINGEFKRIQCTPDLLPSDIIGTQIFNYSTNNFETKLGPIFSNFVLLDEINRSNSKTQSATLEAMQEKQITIDGKTYKLPDIFIVIATENPIEKEDVFELSEAQSDRFIIKEKLDYLTKQQELEMLNIIEHQNTIDNKNILTLEEIKYLQKINNKVHINDSIKEYIINIIDVTRYPNNYLENDISQYIETGASPRATIAFLKCAKANAIINQRDYVTPDDIKELKYRVLRHRISLSFQALCDNITVEEIIDKIFECVETP